MGEWMSAEVYVRVPDDFDIAPWLNPTAKTDDPFQGDMVLHADTDKTPPAPLADLVAVAQANDFAWEWEPNRRLLSHGSYELQVNYGLGEDFARLGDTLRTAGWAYQFESAGKYEIPGECWEWFPDWPEQRDFVQAGEVKALSSDGLRAALAEAATLGVDPVAYLTSVLEPWPGWRSS